MAEKKTPITIIIDLFTNTKSKLWAWIKAGVFITLGLMYTFWALDLIPDLLTGPIGYLDDAIIWLLAAWAIRGALMTIMDKKSTFLGPIGKK